MLRRDPRHGAHRERHRRARRHVTAAEIEAARRDGVLAIVPGVENGFAIGTDLSRLARFRALGARYLTLTHNGHNALADSLQSAQRPRRRAKPSMAACRRSAARRSRN